ncbi:octanoyltransferase [bacterium BMS3Bbin11]|nr:octanoyltransferase [bacterium BMS3Abin11]GBE46604.1 octanoyltransferase [bacterium BMS3Bbin11]GMT41299.1 MAG: octanoyltransferase [bacterium]HDH15756.1 lipoyl(octanoyl) transferase LipB [Gammaproteobacteria bacterium]HDZ78711.1 lipoyl(octanoyl) transferase LipB [Gammaproteobacteria bacterium]
MAISDTSTRLIVRQFDAPQNYLVSWQWMKEFTRSRTKESGDEIWLLEHEPVFTQGIRERAEDIIDSGDIPVVKSDRGGLVTYHGPGQMVAYVLLDLRRSGTGLKVLVNTLEQVGIDVLLAQGIDAARKKNAPGIYVDGRKIASLGLRVMHGCTYHGLSLNVDMDLSPFDRIVPCGLSGIQMTDMKELGVNTSLNQIGRDFVQELSNALGYNPEFIGLPV